MTDSQPDFSAVFDALPAPYLLLAPDFTIVAVNDAYLRAVGDGREQMVGRQVLDVHPDNPADAQADGVARLRASLLRVLATNAPDQMPVQRYDIPVPGQPGVFEERHWSPVNTPVPDGRGGIAWIVHHVKDVTAALGDAARRNTLVRLTDALRDLRSADEIACTALAIVGEALGGSRAGYGRYDAATDTLYVGPRLDGARHADAGRPAPAARLRHLCR